MKGWLIFFTIWFFGMLFSLLGALFLKSSGLWITAFLLIVVGIISMVIFNNQGRK